MAAPVPFWRVPSTVPNLPGSNALIVPSFQIATAGLPRNLRIPQARWPCPTANSVDRPKPTVGAEPVEVIDVDVAITRSRNIVVMLLRPALRNSRTACRPGSGLLNGANPDGIAASTNIRPGRH